MIEAEVDRSRGTMATLLVMNGTMQRGDSIVAGASHGKIKAMFDSSGKAVKARRYHPCRWRCSVWILPPAPGVMFEITPNDKTARSMAEARREAGAPAEYKWPSARSADVWTISLSNSRSGETKELSIILKTDVQGFNPAHRGRAAEYLPAQ